MTTHPLPITIEILAPLKNEGHVYTKSLRNSLNHVEVGQEVILDFVTANVKKKAVVNSYDTNWNVSFRVI
jgi:hypothetical protein